MVDQSLRANSSSESQPGTEGDLFGQLAAKRVSVGPDGGLMGPVSHLAGERQRLADLNWSHFSVRRLGATLGAEIRGLDIAAASSEALVELRDAWLAYKVLFFRDQNLSASDHVGFARKFGDLEVHPFIEGSNEFPELVRFEKDALKGGYENAWHHDVTWRLEPSRGAILRAVHVPDVGGDTLFSDMHAAYVGLPDQLKEQIEGLVAVHDFAKAFGHGLTPQQRSEMREKYPIARHPVVISHPVSGQKLLYVNRVFVTHIEGVSEETSDELLSILYRQAEIPEYQCRFHWEPNSVAMWDNFSVQHYASSDYYPDLRVMERAAIVGVAPAA